MMNILLTLNSYYVRYAAVMLTSLFENNDNSLISVYVLYDSLNDKDKQILSEVVNKNESCISFIHVDKTQFRRFPTEALFPEECYFICMAHKLLPMNLERILYLDADIIINGDIDGLYNMDFENKHLIACGQTFSKINGNYYRVGARPERGELFNSGVMVFNLELMRRDIEFENYYKAAIENSNNSFFYDQGLFNIVFADRAKIISSFDYNFRIGILEEHIKFVDNRLPKRKDPTIFHYVMRDYYKIGIASKPWLITLDTEEENRLFDAGIQCRSYEYRLAREWQKKSFDLWWRYAKSTTLYQGLLKEMEQKKETTIASIMEKDYSTEEQRINESQKKRRILENITNNVFDEGYEKIVYSELETYIDGLDKDSAIKTMRNLIARNWELMRLKKNRTKIAFVVYSSAEWQCETLYRMLESDDRYEPWIVLCGYRHGDAKFVRQKYVDTCKFFRSANRYRVIYMGYNDRYSEFGMLNEFDMFFYCNPFRGCLAPNEANIEKRTISQIIVSVMYGVIIEDKRDAYYQVGYYDTPFFKMAWRYYAESSFLIETMNKEARLGTYNVRVSGLPKLDSLVDKTFTTREGIWKNDNNCILKIIWAPHFNMKEGMNGTFYENYKWMLEYARIHQEISWVVRPHPRMLVGAIEKAVFASSEEYYSYINEWNCLDNASVIEEGDYYDIFVTSDCMILDSLSFLAEYLYTGKPMLQLLPRIPRSLNHLGEAIKKCVYQCRGNDYLGIESFIDRIRCGTDDLLDDRLNLLRHAFPYSESGYGTSASKLIFNDIIDAKAF